jgi:purine-nucleoside phosphorylase
MRPPIEVLKGLGVTTLILTNSAGSLREDMPPGSVMRISDHINFSGANPLIGLESDDRFVGMTNAYDADLAARMDAAAEKLGIPLSSGVYMWFSGPNFETPAEIRMACVLGADAVGMSTVPEVLIARHLGLKVAAASVITNFGAGMTGGELSHHETKDMAPIGGKRLAAILGEMIAGGDDDNA